MYCLKILFASIVSFGVNASPSDSAIYEEVGERLRSLYGEQFIDFGARISHRERGFVASECNSPAIEVERSISFTKKIVSVRCSGIKQYLNVELLGQVPAYVALRGYDRGEILNENMFTLKAVPASTFKSKPVTDFAWGAVQAAKAIQPGNALTASDLRRARLYKRGQLVKAQFSFGALEVVGEFKILEDGYPGDLVKLLNQKSNEVIYGTVKQNKEIAIQ